MQSNGASGEKKVKSWRQIRNLLASGVTTTFDLCHHTGLSPRRVQQVRKIERERSARISNVRDKMRQFPATGVKLPSGIWERQVYTNVWTYTGGDE